MCVNHYSLLLLNNKQQNKCGLLGDMTNKCSNLTYLNRNLPEDSRQDQFGGRGTCKWRRGCDLEAGRNQRKK